MTKIESTIADLLSLPGDTSSFKSSVIYDVGRKNGLTYNQIKKEFLDDSNKIGHGSYVLRSSSSKISTSPSKVNLIQTVEKQQPIHSAMNEDVFVPAIDHTFVQWGEYKNIKKIIDSKMFFPLYISGMSGNGKTMMVEQACAKAKREYIRVQISPETDEDDLIGGFRLVNGETVFHKGPVIKAMEKGCILLIDELDRGSNKIMCLQGVLEGKPVLIKKIGQVVSPARGFNVIATANTKGRGSEDGRYSAANIIDEAFIERFVATIDQPYPSASIEHSIVWKHMEALEVDDKQFCDKLIAWSGVIRKTFEAEGVDELISTRRLCHIVKAYSIFRDRMQAIMMCIARFDCDTKSAFIDLYTKIDSDSNTSPKVDAAEDDEHPF
jgi:hypothetical protein